MIIKNKYILLFLFLLLCLFLNGCYNYQPEKVKVVALTITPEHVETYWVTVDETTTIVLPDANGDLSWHTIVVGSHQEQRQRTIPAMYSLTFSCQHGTFTKENEVNKFPLLQIQLKSNNFYVAHYGSNKVFGITHKNIFKELNENKGLED